MTENNDAAPPVLIKRFGELTPPELVMFQKQYDRCELDRHKKEWRFYKFSSE
jgi:hypothetical protein